MTYTNRTLHFCSSFIRAQLADCLCRFNSCICFIMHQSTYDRCTPELDSTSSKWTHCSFPQIPSLCI